MMPVIRNLYICIQFLACDFRGRGPTYDEENNLVRDDVFELICRNDVTYTCSRRRQTSLRHQLTYTTAFSARFVLGMNVS